MENNLETQTATVVNDYKRMSSKVRTEESKKLLCSRLNRIKGQIEAVKTMINADRHEEDILIQLASCHNSVKAVSILVLEEYIKDCAEKGAKADDFAVVEEAITILRRYL